MKLVHTFINLVAIPLGTLIFFATGGIAALISASIEFFIVQDFFSSRSYNFINSGILAGFIVFCFEFSKLYLHFAVKKAASNKNLCFHLRLSKILLALTIIFSLFCSIVYSTVIFYKSSYDQRAVNEQLLKIDQTLEDDLASAKQEADDNYHSWIAPYEKAVTDATTALNTPVPAEYGPNKTQVYLKELQTQYNSALDEYYAVIAQFSTQRDIWLKDKENSLYSEADKQKELIESKALEHNTAYDNIILSRFLLTIASTFFHANSYPAVIYYLFALFIGIGIAAMLEMIISSSFHFLSFPIEFLVEDTTNIRSSIRDKADKLVIILFKAFCAIIVYLIICAALSVSTDTNTFCMILVSYIFTIGSVAKFFSCKPEGKSTLFSDIVYQTRDSLLQGVISAVSYLLVGIVFGEKALQLDLKTIAIGIGSAISSGLIRVPQFLLTYKTDEDK